MITLGATNREAKALATNTFGDVRYVSFQGDPYILKPWIGTNVAILIPTYYSVDSNIMTQVVGALDRAYEFYRVANGRQPNAYEPTTLYGRDTISVVIDTCGAGCGYLGFNGIEIAEPYFDILYNGVMSNNQYDQVLFYELGRNFWFYSSQLEYFSPDLDPVVTGYAVYMRFLSMDAAGVEGGPFNGYSFVTFCTTVTNLMDSYVVNSALEWTNTFRISQAPANALGLGGTDLIASLLMRIGRDFGGPGFGTNFWRQVALRPAATNTQSAVDNLALAACATVNRNLLKIFALTWKFPISMTAFAEANARWGMAVDLRPTLSLIPNDPHHLILQWQSQVATSYQFQTSTNLQDWNDLGGIIPGDGSVRCLTSSIPLSNNLFFRLNLP